MAFRLTVKFYDSSTLTLNSIVFLSVIGLFTNRKILYNYSSPVDVTSTYYLWLTGRQAGNVTL